MTLKEKLLIIKLVKPEWNPETQEQLELLETITGNLRRELWVVKEKDDFTLIASKPRDLNKDTWEDFSVSFHNIIVRTSKLIDWVNGVVDDAAVLVSRGFPKFFNYFETEQVKKFCMEDYEDLSSLISKGTWIEKIDGQCLLINNIDGSLNCRTRKSFSVEDKLLEEKPQQVAELGVLQKLNSDLFDLEKNEYLKDPNAYTIMCEWVTPYNKLLIDYGNNPKLYLIGIVNNASGELVSQTVLDSLAEKWGVLRPALLQQPSSADSIKSFLENKDLEGAVVYLDNTRMVKVKTKAYLDMVRVSGYKMNIKTLYGIWKSEYDTVFNDATITLEERLERCQISADNLQSLLRKDEELRFVLENTANMGTTKQQVIEALNNWQSHVTNLFYRHISYAINIWLPNYIMSKIKENAEMKKKFGEEILFPFLEDESTETDKATYNFVQKCVALLFELDGPEYKKLLIEAVNHDFVGTDETPAYRTKSELTKRMLYAISSSIEHEVQDDTIQYMSYVCLKKLIPNFVKSVVEAFSGSNEELLNECISAELEFELAENAPAIIIMRGVSGSGKSSAIKKHMSYICKFYREIHAAAVVSADMFFTDDDGSYHFDKDQLPLAHAACKEDCEKLMSDITTKATYIIIDNTNMQLSEFSDYMSLAEKYGYKTILFVPPDMQKLLTYYDIENRDWYKCEGAQQLIETFAARNVHGVTKEIIEHQCSKYQSY